MEAIVNAHRIGSGSKYCIARSVSQTMSIGTSLIKLCDIHRASNGVELFKEFLEAISLQKETKNIYDDIFAKPIYRVYLFSVLRTDFNLWRQLIASIRPDVIHMNQKIFNSFQTNLHHQIGRMDGKAA
eukprot:32165_1